MILMIIMKKEVKRMKMSSEQFADEMIKYFPPKIKPVTKTVS